MTLEIRRDLRSKVPLQAGICILAFVLFACRAQAQPSDIGFASLATTPDGDEVYWARREVVLEPIAPTPEEAVSAGVLTSALGAAIDAWNQALDCATAPRLRLAPPMRGAARDDGRNTVGLLGAAWCPADRRALSPCYDPQVQAITQVRTRTDRRGPASGEIREVDIEVNAVNFKWTRDGETPGTRSLRAVLGHELGHALGLAHVCAGSWPIDASRPRAGSARGSIMYPDPTEPLRPLVLFPDRASALAVCAVVPPRSVSDADAH